MKLLLFDLDGTIVRATRGAAPFNATMREVFGIDTSTSRLRFGGKTDPMIIAELLEEAGLARECEEALLRDFERRLEASLTAALADGSTRIDAIPGVRPTLERLAVDDELALATLTGNFARTARVKLETTGLADFFPVGAFGSDAARRAALPAVARERFRDRTGVDVPLADCVIIGDTPLDHEAADENGMPCMLVATGWTPIEDLAACRPGALFSDWSDPAAIHEALRAL
jgi:phosphoglycolate phosphatase-like HAD superfamily hydrolase